MKRYLMETVKNDALGFPLHFLAGEMSPRMPAIIYLRQLFQRSGSEAKRHTPR